VVPPFPGAKLHRRQGGRREYISQVFVKQKPEGEKRQGCRTKTLRVLVFGVWGFAPNSQGQMAVVGCRCFHCCPLQAERWILPQAKSNVLIRHGWRLPAQPGRQDAGVNNSLAFASQKPKLKNGRDAIFER
jgi:hypothetical protein